MTTIRRTATVAAVLAVVTLLAGPASADPGDLDSSFGGGDGQATTMFDSGASDASAVAVQKDGKILIGGWVHLSADNEAFALVRYLPGGALDQGFGDHGRVVTDFTPGFDIVYDLVVLGNGKIVAAGAATNRFAVARYTPSGGLDHSFGRGDGKATVDFSPDPDNAYVIAKAPGGHLVLGGFAADGLLLRFALARLTATGAVDHTFGGGDGKVVTQVGARDNFISDLVVLADGSIRAAGAQRANVSDKAVVVGYHPNGTLDTDFGDGGKFVHEYGLDFSFRAIVRLPSGKLVATGPMHTEDPNDQNDLAAARITAGGEVDDTFGAGGLAVHDYDSSEYSSDLVRSGNRLLVSLLRDTDVGSRMAVARLLGNGDVDPSFGENGIAESTLSSTDTNAIALQKNRRIVVAGACCANESTSKMMAARFLAA